MPRSERSGGGEAAARRPPLRSLIVTADDFGLAPEVNEAVEIAHTRGILNTASLMVGAPAAADAVARAKRLPGLRVGLHLVLVEGVPTLPAAGIPGLVDSDGRFRDDMTKAGIAMFFSASVRRQLAAEIEAQFAAFAATGLVLDHVNAHKHFHVHPTIGRTLLEVGARYGLRAVRVPNEPRRLLRGIEAASPGVDPMLGPWAALLRRRLRQAGIATADRVVGIAWSGAMRTARVAGVLRALREGCTELYLHPATGDGFAGAAPGYAYAEELAALTAPETLAAWRESGAVATSFSELAAAAAQSPRGTTA